MNQVSSMLERAAGHLAAGRLDEAESDARGAVELAADSAEAHNTLGNVLARRGKDVEAESAFRAAMKLEPALHKPYHNLGNVLRGRGALEEAASMYALAVERNPSPHRSEAALGGVLARLGRRAEAEALFRSALRAAPTKETWLALGVLLLDAKRFGEATAALLDAKARGAAGFAVELDLAEAATGAKNEPVAHAAFDRARSAMEIQPTGQSRVAGVRLATVGLELGRAREASEILRDAVLPSAKPGTPVTFEALDLHWRSLLAAREFEEAWRAFDRALRDGDPRNAYARADLLREAPASGGQTADARMTDTLRRAARDNPDRIELAIVAGTELTRHGFVCEAERLLDEARTKSPDNAEILGISSEVKLQSGDQSEAIRLQREAVTRAPGDAAMHSHLLLLLHYTDEATREEVFAEHVRWGKRFPDVEPPGPRTGARPGSKLRVGFLSGEFFRHSVCRLILPFLTLYDRERFEVHAYMTGAGHDYYTDQVIANVHRFHAVATEHDTDASLAARIRADDLDILVDLSGHTGAGRLSVMALRPARVQATYLGYPDTTGLTSVDYRMTDALADPPGAEAFAVEELVRLPGTAWCFSPGRLPPTSPRSENGPVVFGSFNNLAKLTPEVVSSWARILSKVPRSRLLLKWTSLREEEARAHWRSRFERAGVDPARIELRAFVPEDAAHIAIYGEIDVALDPFPYNGTTTTCEALAMGVPVVTLVGDRHVSRVGLSLLSSVGLEELAAPNLERYERAAVDLALDASRRGALQRALQSRYEQSILSNGQQFTRAFEAALEDMIRRGPKTAKRTESP